MKFKIISECDPDECFIEGCTGVYVTKVVVFMSVDHVNGKKNIDVTTSICSQCGGNRNARLVKFIRENF